MKLSRSKKAHCFDECIFIILGATGDLTKRKLIPALYQLIADGKLCHFAVIGVSVDATTVQTLLDQAAPYIPKCKPRIMATCQSKVKSSSFRQYEKFRFSVCNVAFFLLQNIL